MSLEEQTTEELLFRQKLVNAVLRLLRSEIRLMADPRAPAAIAEYERQMAQIVEETAKRQKHEPEVIQKLPPARLKGKGSK